jgi:NAD(P)-dependent dehydrogenase (short-subunit alcohol dehydrogenase family)
MNTEIGSYLGLKDQVCVVTGGGSGIGAEIACQFAAAGALVAVLDWQMDAAEKIAVDIQASGQNAIAVKADVSSFKSITLAAELVQSQLGPCGILVNNAAIRHRASVHQIDLADWNRVLSVNLTGALICSQIFSNQMMQAGNGGSIVHVSSLLGVHPQFEASAYGVSKAGLNYLSKSLALELAHYRIRSNVVSPGFTRTPANEKSYSDKNVSTAREKMIPIGRVALPIDIAQVIVMLCSQRSGYISGEEITVDGGVSTTLMARVPKSAE